MALEKAEADSTEPVIAEKGDAPVIDVAEMQKENLGRLGRMLLDVLAPNLTTSASDDLVDELLKKIKRDPN